MIGAARAVVRVALAWVLTYVLAWAVAELGREPPAVRAARAAAALPPDDVRAPEARRAIIARTERELDLGGGPAARLAGAARRAVTLDLGVAWRDRRPVADVVGPGLAATGGRAALALLLALGLGAVAGLAATSRGGVAGAAIGAVTAAALAMPSLWLCQLALAAVAPGPAGAGALAVLVLATAPAAVVAAHVRAATAEFVGSPLATAVVARGAGPGRLVWIHGARLALPGLAPLAASTVGYVLGAAAVVERALAVPGAGRQLATAVAAGDVPVVAALAALAAAVVAAVGALAAAVARRADPRLGEGAP
ncbi:MAG TPA: ABC transporter permease subunit [Kofleriaceae bacterium]|nr:ABC transporter permease subunit [Kofleriaceae bacterium]